MSKSMRMKETTRTVSQALLALAFVLTGALWLPGPPIGLALSVGPVAQGGDELRAGAEPFLFGVINDQGDHYSDEWARGVRATNFELHWMYYSPQEGVYNQAYISEMQSLLADLKAQGWLVQLVPGYQYAPAWVYTNYPGTTFVNQYGERFLASPTYGSSHRVINAPFNPRARQLISGYLERIFQDFDAADFDSVRVGGGVQGELRYPPKEWNGHSNSYWAFDVHAQDPAQSGIPQNVVGWRPGIDPNPGSIGRAQLLVNPGFEDLHHYFAIPGWSPDDEVSTQLVANRPHGGARALKVTITSPHRVHQFVRVDPDTTYRFGGWLRAVEVGGRARAFFEQYDSGSQPVSDAPYGALETNTTEWAYRTGSLTTSATTRYLKVELDGHQPGTYFFDDLWLEKDGASNHQDRDIDVPMAFYDWYVQTQTDYQAWQIGEIRKHFAGQLDVLYAGKGLLADQVTDALTNDLRGDGWSEAGSALYAAALYDRHVADLRPADGVTVYLTGIDEPAPHLANDRSPYPGDWSAARWVAHLAEQRGLPIWAENSGQDGASELWRSARRMAANDMLGLMWAFESELYANPNPAGYATIDEYESVIHIYTSPFIQCLPLTVRNK